MFSTPFTQLSCLILPRPDVLAWERGRPAPTLPEVHRSLPSSLRAVTPCRFPLTRALLTALKTPLRTDAHLALYRTDHPDWGRFHPRLGPRAPEPLAQKGISITLSLLTVDLERVEPLPWGASRAADARLEDALEWLNREHGAYVIATDSGARALSALPEPLTLDAWSERQRAWSDHLRRHLGSLLEAHTHPWHALLRLPRVRVYRDGVHLDLEPPFELDAHRLLSWPPPDTPLPEPPPSPEASPARQARARLASSRSSRVLRTEPGGFRLMERPQKAPSSTAPTPEASPEPSPPPAPPQSAPMEGPTPHQLWAQRLRDMYQSGALNSERFVRAMRRLTTLETGLDFDL